MTRIILASTSSARKQILEKSGLIFDVMAPMVDEDAIKESLQAEGLGSRNIADALAEAKAVKLSVKHPAALVRQTGQP